MINIIQVILYITYIITAIVLLSRIIFPIYSCKQYLPLQYYINNSNDITFQNLVFHSLFSVTVYQSKYQKDHYMIHVKPQDYYFFIENGSVIYHPQQRDEILKQYVCASSKDYDPVYLFPVVFNNNDNKTPPPEVFCHLKLSYLKKHVFVNEIYRKHFNTLQSPFKTICKFFQILQKSEGLNKLFIAHIS